jgi:NAD(P)-dependent dehydrogenase (short-subunit alcohol dehydrogenase family)
MRLNGKVSVITGGANGIGRATVLRFLDEGAKVIVADNDEQSGHETLAIAKKAGHQDSVRFILTDVAKEEDVGAMIDLAITEFDHIDIVFNNAAVLGEYEPIWETTIESWDYVLDVVAKGVFLCIKHAARAMRHQGQGGSIINTASIAGLSGGGGPLLYSAAKAAVINLTKTSAVQLGPDRIRVNVICPGGILTKMIDQGMPEETAKVLNDLQPWPEHGKGEHIAGAAMFLASDDAQFVTGEALVVDGGLTAKGPATFNRFN